jgi:RNA polymerase sigma-70 factor (ECF subfamily)
MHIRKKSLPEVSLDETLDPTDEDGPKKDYGSEDQVLAGSIDRVNLERAIANLPPGYRLMFVLHDIEGYEHNEIAELMNCSAGNSKSQLHKARMKLRGVLNITRAENGRPKKINKQQYVTMATERAASATATATATATV